MIDRNMKWNDYPSDVLYLWDGETIFRIAEGTGDNLLPEDEERGWVDYWLTDYYNFDDGNGGQWMENELISDIDYTIQGVLDRLEECDLWISNWKIMDEAVGENLFNEFESYFANRKQARYHKEKSNEIKKEIKNLMNCL